jgi:predicted outer membrane protein
MKDSILRGATLTALAVCMAMAGCKGKDTGAATDTTVASAMKTPDSARTGAASGAAVASLTDANFAALLDEVNAADSMLAAAALPKLSSPGARNFAKRMMGEHHALHLKGIRLEKAQKITPELPAADPFRPAVGVEQSALGSMPKGPAYDSTYIANEVDIHQAVIQWQGSNTPQNPALQAYMKDAKTVIQRHLDAGLEVQTKLGGGPMS